MTTTCAIAEYLDGLRRANRSRHTIRAYATDLARLAERAPADVADLAPSHIAAVLDDLGNRAPATRARALVACASFTAWAVRHGRLETDPAVLVERPTVPAPAPRACEAGAVERLMREVTDSRDRLILRLLSETGARVGEVLGLYVEDVTLTPGDERLTIHGKGGKTRTVLVDGPTLVAALRRRVRELGRRTGPLFPGRDGAPLRYQTWQEAWARYCERAGVDATIHQLRHTHATSLLNGGVSLATVRKRLGHARIQTTLRYAELADATADAEVRAYRRRQEASI